MRAAACSLLDNALSHEGTRAHTHTRTTASVATFPSKGCGRVRLQQRADSSSCSTLPAAAAACSLITGSLGKNTESTVKVQISRWEITPPPTPSTRTGIQTTVRNYGRSFLPSANQGQCLCSLCSGGRGSRFSRLLQCRDTPRPSPR